MENPTPRDSPNNECIIKANAQATFGLGVLLAKIPFPIAGIKNNHGTDTLTAPKKSHELQSALIFQNLLK